MQDDKKKCVFCGDNLEENRILVGACQTCDDQACLYFMVKCPICSIEYSSEEEKECPQTLYH